MADELKQTAILDFQVDQGQAIKDLEKTESAILDLKKQQSELNKEYKAGSITQQQYVAQNLKLQQSLKKEQDQKRTLNKLIETESNSRNALKTRISQLTREYDNLNLAEATSAKRADELSKEIKDLSEQVNKTSKDAGLFKDQIGNYPQAFQQAASQIRVAGVSVGDLGTKLASFANPATAVVGIMTGLVSAYAASGVGARDLARAQDILSAAVTASSNAFGDYIDRITGGDGSGDNGPFAKLISGLLAYIDLQTAVTSNLSADASRALREVELADLAAKRFAKEQLDLAEEQRRMRDAEDLDLQTRLNAAYGIEQFINARERELVKVQEDRLKQLNFLLSLDRTNLELKKLIKQTEFEIADIQEDSQGKRTEALNGIIALEKELLEIQRQQAFLARQGGNNVPVSGIDAGNLGLATPDAGPATASEQQERTRELIEGNAELQVQSREKLNQDLLKLDQKAGIEEVRQKQAIAEAKIEVDRQTAQASAQIAGNAAELFADSTGAYKVLASAQTLISTYLSAQRAFEALVGIPIVGPGLGAAAAAVAVAQGLQRVATINGIEFAEGGYTGPGRKYEPAGVVHKGEYVTPKHIVESPAAQPHLRALEGMRTGYADGGFVTNRNISAAQQNLLMINALKNLPPPQVDVREVSKVQKRIQVRETQSRV